ncbi:MAG: AsmA-like C-terminal region-containing protein [Burkholderiales bacterium]
MDLKTVYTKTGKGMLEMKNKSLPKDLGGILAQIDGKSNVKDVVKKEGKLPENKIKELLQKLESDGYIRVFSTGPQTMFSGNVDLDFTGGLVVSEIKADVYNEAKARQEALSKPGPKSEDKTIRERADAEAKARRDAEAKAKADAERAKAEAETRAKLEAEVKAKREAEAKAKSEMEARSKAEAEAKAKAEAAARAKAEAEAKAKAEAAARAKAEAEAKAKAEAAARAKLDADIKAKAEAEAKARKEAEENAQAEVRAQEAAKVKDEIEIDFGDIFQASSKPKIEDESAAKAVFKRGQGPETKMRLEAEARLRAEIEAGIKAEEEARRRAEEEANANNEIQAKAKAEEEDWARAEAEIRASIKETARKEKEIQLDFSSPMEPPRTDFRKETREGDTKFRKEEEKRTEQEEKERAKEEAIAQKEAEAQSKREAKERAKAEAEAQKRAEKVEKARARAAREPFNWKLLGIGLVILIVAVIGLVHVIPLNNYIPGVEKLAADTLEEPVTIANLHVALLPSPQVKLEGVTIGKLKDVKIDSVSVAGLGLVLGGGQLDSVDVDTLTLEQDSLARIGAWGHGKGSQTLRFSRVGFRNVRLVLKNIPLAPISGELTFTDDGKMLKTSVRTMDNKVNVKINAKRGQYDVTVNIKDWEMPLGPEIAFEYLDAQGTAGPDGVQLTDIDAKLYDGLAKGTVTLNWDNGWKLSGDFDAKSMDLKPVLNIFARNFSMTGKLDTRGSYTMRAQQPEKLFEAPRVEGTFTITRGTLNNMDLVRALQAQNREGIRGGKTLFDEFAGRLQFSDGRYKFTEMKLVSGPLTAVGFADISPDKKLTGRANVEIKSRATHLKNSFAVSGSLNDLVLQPQ